MYQHTKDILAGLSFLIFALLFGSQLDGLSGVSLYFPQSIIIFILIGGIYLVIKGLLTRHKKERDNEMLALGRVIVISVMSIVYVILIPLLGFFTASFAFLFIAAIVYRERDVPFAKSCTIAILFTTIFSLIVWFGFQFLLGVPTPEGIFI